MVSGCSLPRRERRTGSLQDLDTQGLAKSQIQELHVVLLLQDTPIDRTQ